MVKLQMNLQRIAEGEGIPFVHDKGKQKSEVQKRYEELEECGDRLMGYKKCFEILGKDRNSYFKTDLEATFMRMKEDHMLDGQLKPAYNVQIAVENYFIIHGYVSNDRTDYNTLIPVLEKYKKALGEILEEETADSGYCSERNLCISSRIRPSAISSSRTMKNGRPVRGRRISAGITTWHTRSLRMSSIISAMTEGNCGISVQKAGNRTDIPRYGKSMDVQTAADVNIKPVVCINTMQKGMEIGIS